MKVYGLIMAGGGGTRFWPLSRKRVPKQLLNLDGKEVMLNETIDRLSGVVEKENIFIFRARYRATLYIIYRMESLKKIGVQSKKGNKGKRSKKK